MNDLGILTIGVGIAVSMIYDWRTGYGSGGLVSAGTIALTLYSPLRVGVSLLAALLIWPLLDFAVGRWGLHGRARVQRAGTGGFRLRAGVRRAGGKAGHVRGRHPDDVPDRGPSGGQRRGVRKDQ